MKTNENKFVEEVVRDQSVENVLEHLMDSEQQEVTQVL